jgi:hypothetical protein
MVQRRIVEGSENQPFLSSQRSTRTHIHSPTPVAASGNSTFTSRRACSFPSIVPMSHLNDDTWFFVHHYLEEATDELQGSFYIPL